ncbi:MAG: prolipoprotein diacylglyceryl transferase family protein [bacterium]
MYPVLLKIGNLTVYTYGTILYLDLLLSVYLLSRFCNRFGLEFSRVFNYTIVLVFSMYIGGKLGFLIINREEVDSLFDFMVYIIDPHSGGLTIIGSIIFSALVLYFASFLFKFNFLALADLFSFVSPFSIFVGRLACLFAGCCYGKPSSWGVFINGTTRYPTQIIESLLSLMLFLYFLYLLKRYNQPGTFLGSFFIGYGFIRFFVEFFRESNIVMLNLSSAQIFCIMMIIVGFVLLIWIKRADRQELGGNV